MGLFTKLRDFSTGAAVGFPMPGQRKAVEQIIQHPKQAAPKYVLSQDRATNLDVVAFGNDFAKYRALRNTGRIAGLAAGAYFGGEAIAGGGSAGTVAEGGDVTELGAAGTDVTETQIADTGLSEAVVTPAGDAAVGDVLPAASSSGSSGFLNTLEGGATKILGAELTQKLSSALGLTPKPPSGSSAGPRRAPGAPIVPGALLTPQGQVNPWLIAGAVLAGVLALAR